MHPVTTNQTGASIQLRAMARRPRLLLHLLLLLGSTVAAAAAAAFVGSPPHSARRCSRLQQTEQQKPRLPAPTPPVRPPLLSSTRLVLASSHTPLSSTRGGGGGGGGRAGSRLESVRAAVRGLLAQVVTKHLLVAGMVASIALAAMNPAVGRVGGPLRPELSVNVVGVSLIFLLSGLSLRVDQLASAAKDLRLNAAIQGFNLGMGPLLGLLFQALLLAARVDPRLATGLLIISCLPTTVNMCIVLASAAHASLATAVFNAVLSNFLGVFIAPATIFLCAGAAVANIPYADVVEKLIYKVLVPVLLGVALRARVPFLRKALESPRAKLPLKLTTESILIGIIYTTFCQSFLAGLAVTGRDLMALALSVPAFHLLSLALMLLLARAVSPHNRAAQVAAAFTGSHKTLAFGMPLIKTIFETSSSMAHYAAPLLFIHPSQLVLGSLLVPALARYIEEGEKGAAAA